MSIYREYKLQPSIPHQCFHESEVDGHRCRGRAMHNEIMCFQHRVDDIPTVLENDPFLIETLHDRPAIQHAVTQVAARLACNHIDLKRAALLLQSFQIAASNLTAHDRAAIHAAARQPTAHQPAAHQTGCPVLTPLGRDESSPNSAPFTPPTTELDPNLDPAAVRREQARRDEYGLEGRQPLPTLSPGPNSVRAE